MGWLWTCQKNLFSAEGLRSEWLPSKIKECGEIVGIPEGWNTLVAFAQEREKQNCFHPPVFKSKRKGSRELNNLVSSVNYDKGRGLFCCGPYIGRGESRPQEMSQVVDEDLILECLRFGECGSQTNSK